MPDIQTPVEIFCAYARTDTKLLKELDAHLSLLKNQGYISTWYDRLLVAGTDWEQELDAHLNSASVILLLISSSFMNSNYCYGVEMKRALERERAGEARVIPIILRPVDWKEAPFAYLQALPEDARPITLWADGDMAFMNVAANIRKSIADLAKKPLRPSGSSGRDPAIQQIMAAEDDSVIDNSTQKLTHGIAHSQEIRTKGRGQIKNAVQEG